MKLGTFIIAASLIFGATSCKKEGCTDMDAVNYNAEAEKDDNSCTYADPNDSDIYTKVSGEITADATWSASNCYLMEGRVIVNSGVTLTIEPGTIIKAAEGLNTNATALIVARGGKINAEGTADQPIIFTSVLDSVGCEWNS